MKFSDSPWFLLDKYFRVLEESNNINSSGGCLVRDRHQIIVKGGAWTEAYVKKTTHPDEEEDPNTLIENSYYITNNNYTINNIYDPIKFNTVSQSNSYVTFNPSNYSFTFKAGRKYHCLSKVGITTNDRFKWGWQLQSNSNIEGIQGLINPNSSEESVEYASLTINPDEDVTYKVVCTISPSASITIDKTKCFSEIIISEEVTDELLGFQNLKVKLKYLENNENYFNFEVGGYWKSTGEIKSSSNGVTIPSTGQPSYQMTLYDTELDTDKINIENGDEIYFRKDSYFHDWLWDMTNNTLDTNNDGYSDYLLENNISYFPRDYVNLNRQFLYFGPIYDIDKDNYQWRIIFYGMKDYTYQALPPNNRTSKIKELLKLYFDKIHSHPYNMLKYEWNLLDPSECGVYYLEYISKMYNTNTNDDLDESRRRQFVKNIIHYLKRIGTYNALFIIWKIMIPETINRLNIFERWHDYGLVGIPINHFEDYIYTNYYTGTELPDTCAGEEYYSTSLSGSYPSKEDFELGGKTLSTHYKVEYDLSCEPMDNESVASEEVIESLITNWEDIRPVVRVADYTLLISPKVDFSQVYKSTYTQLDEYLGMILSKICVDWTGGESTGSFIHTQLTSSTQWVINHYSENDYLITQCFNSSYELITPSDIYALNENVYIIEFEESVTGFAHLKIPDYTHEQSTSSTNWNAIHGLGNKEVLAQPYDNIRKVFSPYSMIMEDSPFRVDTETYVSELGYEPISESEYVHDQSLHSLTWTINHNLDQQVLVHVTNKAYETIIPSSITLVNPNTVRITFDEVQVGYAFITGVSTTQYTFLSQLINGSFLIGPGYWKVGNGENLDTYNVNTENDLKSPILSGNNIKLYSFDDIYVLEVDILDNTEINITEFGIFDGDGNIVFYSKIKDMYKHKKSKIKIWYKIYKIDL